MPASRSTLSPSPPAGEPVTRLQPALFRALLNTPGVVIGRYRVGVSRVYTPWGAFEDDDAEVALLLALNAAPASVRAR